MWCISSGTVYRCGNRKANPGDSGRIAGLKRIGGQVAFFLLGFTSCEIAPNRLYTRLVYLYIYASTHVPFKTLRLVRSFATAHYNMVN